MHKGLFSLIIIFILALSPVMASEDIDQNQAQVLREQGVIMPLEDILENVGQIKNGRVMEVELEKKRGIYVYEIEIADPAGQVWELKFNASDGSLISQERDD